MPCSVNIPGKPFFSFLFFFSGKWRKRNGSKGEEVIGDGGLGGMEVWEPTVEMSLYIKN